MFKFRQVLVSKNRSPLNLRTIQIIERQGNGIYKIIYLDTREHDYFTYRHLELWYDIQTYNYNALWHIIND